jgi:hypothetical protein
MRGAWKISAKIIIMVASVKKLKMKLNELFKDHVL